MRLSPDHRFSSAIALAVAVVGFSASLPAAPAFAQADAAAANLRLQQLEEQIRSLTGQVEGLQFQMTQMQTQLQSLQAGQGGMGQTGMIPGAPGLPPGGVPASGLDPNSVIDPGTEGFAVGAPEAPLGTVPQGDLNAMGTDNPLDLSFDPNAGPVNDADADAQYRAGVEAVQSGNYEFAEDQFRQFIALFPDHPQAPEATNWLGQALLQRQAYDEAADVLLTGFQTYPNSQRAPDMLLKLGTALAGAGETETACRTFAEVERRYPQPSQEVVAGLQQQRAAASC